MNALPRAWCKDFEQPCGRDCYGSECQLRLAPKPVPADPAPEHKPLPHGFFIAAIALLCAFMTLIGLGIGALFMGLPR